MPFSLFFVGDTYFVASVNICTMIEVSSQQSRSVSYTYSVLLPLLLLLLLLLCVAILLLLLQQQYCCFLQLFVIVCRMTKFIAGLLNLIPVVSSSSFNATCFWMYPLALLYRIYGLDLPTLLPACAEPRRVSEAPLVMRSRRRSEV